MIHKSFSESETLPELEVVIYLQDFNKQIVEDITYENVKQFQRDLNEKWSKNGTAQKTSPIKLTCKFVYGDWKDLHDSKDILPGDYFNLILTSETIYNSENYAALLDLFKRCLVKEKEEALVLLSAKTYYFGCGGRKLFDTLLFSGDYLILSKIFKSLLGNLLEFLRLAESSAYKFKASDNLLFNDSSVEVSQQASNSFFNSTTSTIGKEIVTLYF